MAELRSLREGKFRRVSPSLENLRALVDELHSRLLLAEDSRLVQPGPYGQGRPERPTTTRCPGDLPSLSAEQWGALAHLSTELNATCQRARGMERSMATRLPGAPTRGPGGTVPPSAAASEGWRLTGVGTSRTGEGIRPPMDSNFASETQALWESHGQM